MYKDIAWNNFIKTGSIESFLEYKELGRISDLDSNKGNDFENIDINVENKGRRDI